MRVTVRYLEALDSARVFNLTSPRWLPEISLQWMGARPWHDPRYEPVRDLMESMYVDGFNKATGHFELLESSILREGVLNPVMLSAGGLDRRRSSEIPPEIRGPELIVSEYLGGSRLWVAQRLGMIVPAIVNDFADVVDGPILTTEAEVRSCFAHPPRGVRFAHGVVQVHHLPYVHIPEGRRYGVGEQSRIRRRIIDEIQEEVAGWLREHDTEDVHVPA